MSLMDAPAYDERAEKRGKALLIGGVALCFLLLILTFVGFATGHGWLYSNLPVEHRVDRFLSAIERQDFSTAYAIYTNDKDWQAHAAEHKGYPLDRFTEDWTKYSPVGAIHSHHVDKSVTDGSGFLGTTVIVGSTVNGGTRIFIPVQRSDGTLTYPPPHIFTY